MSDVNKQSIEWVRRGLVVLSIASLLAGCVRTQMHLEPLTDETCFIVPPGPAPDLEKCPSCKAAIADCAQPSPAEVFGALVAVEYYSNHAVPPGPNSLMAIQPPAQLRRVLTCDRSFGWDARLAFASQKLGVRIQKIGSKCLDCLAAKIKSSVGCCAGIVACKHASATPSDMRAAIDFKLNVPARYEDIAKILDPQCWPFLPASSFKTVERQPTKVCPRRKPPVLDRRQTDIGKTWCDPVYEHFLYEPAPGQGQEFSNTLFFKTNLRPNGPCRDTFSDQCYELEYGLCPGGAHDAVWGGNKAQGAIIRDSGCTSANNPADDGTDSTSMVTAVKRLELTPCQCGENGCNESCLCGDDGCDQFEADVLNSMMNAIMIATRISVCVQHTAPSDCEVSPCGSPVPICGNFECGVTDFQCR